MVAWTEFEGDGVSRTTARILTAVAFAWSQAALALLLWMPPNPSGWASAFRGYYPFDQLSYAAIASSVAAGASGLEEPFTVTGTSYYPSAWYRFLGLVARATGAGVPALWTALGWSIVAIAVAVAGWVALRLSGRWWAPAVAGSMLAVGTLSAVTQRNWFTSLDSHAVLWGPYGVLYPLNGEVAALSLGSIALSLLLLASRQGRSRASRRGLIVTAAALVGLCANIQTYAFFTIVAIAAWWAGSRGLLDRRSPRLALLSVGLLLLAFIAGPALATAIGALPVFALLIAVAVPGALVLARRDLPCAAGALAALVVTAAPQALLVARGFAAADPFLVYRQDVSQDLGVPIASALVATAPMAVIWLIAALALRHRPGLLAPLLGLAGAWAMLAFNDAWGFAQEPYRLWIDANAIAAILIGTLLPVGLASARVPWHRSMKVAAGVAILLVGVSLVDTAGFRVASWRAGTIDLGNERSLAIEAAASGTEGLVAAGPCIDPQQAKLLGRVPVAFYNRGIAWPADLEAVDLALASISSGALDPGALDRAGITELLRDTACTAGWDPAAVPGARRVAVAAYGPASAIERWVLP